MVSERVRCNEQFHSFLVAAGMEYEFLSRWAPARRGVSIFMIRCPRYITSVCIDGVYLPVPKAVRRISDSPFTFKGYHVWPSFIDSVLVIPADISDAEQSFADHVLQVDVEVSIPVTGEQEIAAGRP